jgi:hypothetical protein
MQFNVRCLSHEWIVALISSLNRSKICFYAGCSAGVGKPYVAGEYNNQ